MRIKLFGFLFVCVLEMAADMRAFGQCCWCDADDGCALGADNIGTLDVPECQSANCNNYDCSYCDENPENPPDDGGSTGICPGYGDCGGVPSNYLHPNPGNCRCKSFNNVNCDGQSVSGWHICSATPSGVQYYDVFIPSGGYHFEGNKCYSNTRACSKFDVFINNGRGGAWTCKPEYQTGNATWVDEGDGMWNVIACKCESEAVVADGCAVGVVKHNRDGNYIQKATDKIRYEQTHRYCQKCAAGKIPKKDSAETNGVKFRPDNPSGNYDWGVYRCENVSVPYYATGCTIDFTQSNFNNVVTGCHAQCSSQYLTITTNGATSADDCKPDSTEYTDGIGKFTLGSDSCN